MSSTKNTLHRAFGIDAAAHGDLTGTTLDSDVNLEVVALGLPRTGTTSIQAAINKLGFGPGHQSVDLFRSRARNEAFMEINKKLLDRMWQAGDPALSARLRDLMRGYRSSTDNPICFLPDEAYAAYPKAKYIYYTAGRGRKKQLVEEHYGRNWLALSFLRRTDDMVQDVHELCRRRYGAFDADLYDKHNAHVQTLIPTDQLLVYNVREGWEPLCKYLGVPVPSEEYPKLNETGAMQRIYFGMMMYGGLHWMMYIGVAAVLVRVAVNA